MTDTILKWIAERRPSIHSPAANWADGAQHNSEHYLRFKAVASGDAHTNENLRMYCQHFSGMEMDCKSRNESWWNRYHTITKYVPPQYRMLLPDILGERGVQYFGGGIINHDTYAYQERLNLLWESGVLDWLNSLRRPVTIVEVGGGFGGLAYGIKRALRVPVSYVIVDLPESLLFSAKYLQAAMPHCQHMLDSGKTGIGFQYVPNHQFDRWAGINRSPVDLAINTLSLVEMSDEQMEYYARSIRWVIDDKGVFFEQNHDGRWMGFKESKRFLSGFFDYGQRIKPKTIPALVKGRADLWSNIPMKFLEKHKPTELPPLIERVENLVSDWFWVKRKLVYGLQRALPPKAFAAARKVWTAI